MESIFREEDPFVYKYHGAVSCKSLAGGRSIIDDNAYYVIDQAADDPDSVLFDLDVDELIDNRKIGVLQRDDRGYPFFDSFIISAALREGAKSIDKIVCYRPDGSVVNKKAVQFIRYNVRISEDHLEILNIQDSSLVKSGSFERISFFDEYGNPDTRYVEVVSNVKLQFTIESTLDTREWPKIWRMAEGNGIGAARRHGYGDFVVSNWTGGMVK